MDDLSPADRIASSDEDYFVLCAERRALQRAQEEPIRRHLAWQWAESIMRYSGHNNWLTVYVKATQLIEVATTTQLRRQSFL